LCHPDIWNIASGNSNGSSCACKWSPGQRLWTTVMCLINSLSHKAISATKQSARFPVTHPTSCNLFRREFISHSGNTVSSGWELICSLKWNWKPISALLIIHLVKFICCNLYCDQSQKTNFWSPHDELI
jgi:hypothetical protein